MISNKEVYEDNAIVENYVKRIYLYKPEEKFLSEFNEQLKNMRMLDIGVGAGRTTHFFANRVKSYTGIDYSINMVDVCKRRFPRFNFLLADVRDMRIFKDNYFDLILFSFNGLDSISHEDRLKSMKEIKRVGKSGGVFFFSSHNLNSVDELFSMNLSPNPIKNFRRIREYILLRSKNQRINYDNGYSFINDGAHNFRLTTYYVTPQRQIEQLSDFGFKKTKIYSLINGEPTNDYNIKDRWLYYLCEI